MKEKKINWISHRIEKEAKIENDKRNRIDAYYWSKSTHFVSGSTNAIELHRKIERLLTLEFIGIEIKIAMIYSRNRAIMMMLYEYVMYSVM